MLKQLFNNQDIKYLLIDDNNKLDNIDIISDNIILFSLTTSITLNINIKKDCTLVYACDKNNADITLNINIDNNLNCHIVTLVNNDTSYNRCVNTNILSNSYIEVDELYINNDMFNQNANYYVNGNNSNLLITNSIIANSTKTNNYNSNVKHNNTNSLSNLTTYAISKNNSFLNVYTNGIIPQGMSKTTLNQKTKGIILDDESQISANPILEIDEYDVVASHGASIGAIDDEDLYYLMSRGLTKDDSQKLIINGLIYPFIEKINNKELKQYCIQLIDKAL